MRTKIMVLSALLGTLGTASLMAQSTNVYSLNAVGYINITVLPGYNIVSCPLIASPDNTIGTLLNNTNGQYNQVQIFAYSPSAGYTIDTGAKLTNPTNGWENGGTITMNPGQAVFLQNPRSTNLVLTFVGTVPQGSLTNTLVPGYNLVSSAVPTSGDLVTNSITDFTNYQTHDSIFTYTPTSGYTVYTAVRAGVGSGYNGTWSGTTGDPTVANVGQGFFYQDNSTTTNVVWVENFSVSQ